jgi:hypothetical protein
VISGFLDSDPDNAPKMARSQNRIGKWESNYS